MQPRSCPGGISSGGLRAFGLGVSSFGRPRGTRTSQRDTSCSVFTDVFLTLCPFYSFY